MVRVAVAVGGCYAGRGGLHRRFGKPVIVTEFGTDTLPS